MAIFEGQNLFSREHVQVMHEYWYLFCISAGLGFLVTLSGLGVVQNAGAKTLFKAMSQIKKMRALFCSLWWRTEKH